MDYIKAVRTIRNDMNVHPAKKDQHDHRDC